MEQEKRLPGTFRILIGCTGSVATIKLPQLIQCLAESIPGAEMKVVVTECARRFFSTDEIPSGTPVLTDANEWSAWKHRGDPVLHIDLAKWADLMVLAPLDANTLAKIAQGLCDNLLLCILRAWEPSKPLLFCPAMNTKMWQHPITAEHVSRLRAWGYHEVPCIEKTLMCGDTGPGAMAEVDTIVQNVREYLKL
ncbi:phosphopantothenoylcysteine decarboxylase [Phlebotomus argentipes]|uniref:phosphopantothenoylcysteine decarboxylase n=1 Tax=Phlebotomus argentipes TaxID=94469 RepID=UPI002893220D|nr:phosphopantothenoylcysteine decarboxylase [Phlebotomus argentipes]